MDSKIRDSNIEINSNKDVEMIENDQELLQKIENKEKALRSRIINRVNKKESVNKKNKTNEKYTEKIISILPLLSGSTLSYLLIHLLVYLLVYSLIL
jgi:hypothetical protein